MVYYIRVVLLSISIISSLSVFSQNNYTSTANGSYSDAIWTTQAPDPIPFGDTVFILHNITLPAQLDVNGVLYIGSAGSISGNKKLKNENANGSIVNYGKIDISHELHVDGSWYNYNYAYAKKIHLDGYLCNTDTIEISPDQKLDLHGGTLDCGGVIILCQIKIHDGDSGPSNLNSVDLDTCSQSCPVVTINIQDQPIVDSQSVAFCGELLSSPLPIVLGSYDVYPINDFVKIDWATEIEVNNDFFTIHRSLNGKDWEELLTINGAGQSNIRREYSIMDENPFPGISYYRLKQTDYNGQNAHFGIKQVNMHQNGMIVKAFPNPAKDQFTLNTYFEGTKQITITNQLGNIIYSNSSWIGLTYDISVIDWPDGIYFIIISDGINMNISKVLIQ